MGKTRSWASTVSVAYAVRLTPEERKEYGDDFSEWIGDKNYLLAWLREYTDIPRSVFERAKKGMTLLESFLSRYPKDYYSYRVFSELIRRREIFIERFMFKVCLRGLDRYFRTRMHRSVKEVIGQFPEVYNEILRGIASGMDRMRSIDNIRMDFVIARMERLLPKLFRRIKDFFSISHGTFDSEHFRGEVSMDYLPPGMVAEGALAGGSMWSADPALIVEAMDEIERQRSAKRMRFRIRKKG